MTSGQTHEDEQFVKQHFPNAQKANCVWDGLPLTSQTHLGCDWEDAAQQIRKRIESLPPQAAPESETDVATDNPQRCVLKDGGNWRCHKKAGRVGACSTHDDCGEQSLQGTVCGFAPQHSVPHAWESWPVPVPVVAEKTDPIHNDLCDKCLKDFSSCQCRKTAHTLPVRPARYSVEYRDCLDPSCEGTHEWTREQRDGMKKFALKLLAELSQVEARNQELMGLLSMPPLRAYVFTQIGDEAYYKAEDVRSWFDQIKEERCG